MDYFKCEKCHAMEGGIYGKGPLKRYRTSTSRGCRHNWERISRSEFKLLASQWHGEVWRNYTSGFWRPLPDEEGIGSE